jgi:hypothetical protein
VQTTLRLYNKARTMQRSEQTKNTLKGNHVHWTTSTKILLMQPPDLLLNFIVKSFGSPVRICTEHCRTGHTYRCHPAYRSGGAISYDWMHVQYKGASKQTFVIPCRLAAVVVLKMLADSLEPYCAIWCQLSYWHQLCAFN